MMNWTMGRYIGELDAEGRDRLIAAPEFNDGHQWWWGDCGCLVGTAEEWNKKNEDLAAQLAVTDRHQSPPGRTPLGSPWGSASIRWVGTTAAYRYPAAVARFGKARVVRAIKLRAARLNGCDPSSIASLTAAVRVENAGV